MASKASFVAELLSRGKPVKRYKERGNSMLPLLKSNQPVTLTPVDESTELKTDDVVFCYVKGRYVLHKILYIHGNYHLIGNMKGYINGWVSKENIYGVVTHIWDK